MMIFVSMVVIGLLILQDILLCYFLQSTYINHYQEWWGKEFPRVSVLVPARNEEAHLMACLQGLGQIHYPQDKIEFIIGDDQSTDSTAEIIQEWASMEANRIFVPIKPDKKKINGKVNALSQMANLASGEYFFFTDADSVVNPSWVKELLGSFKPENGLVSGITAVRSTSLFSAMQGMDWWLTLGMVKVGADLNYAIGALGNNMMVSKDVYWAVGGFDRVSFSITEDLALAQAIIKSGYRPVQQVTPRSLVVTKSEKNFLSLLIQRKRWMRGAMTLPWNWKLFLFLQVGFFPAMLFLLLHFPWFGAVVWLLKAVVQSLFIKDFSAKTETEISPWHFISFELYYLILSWSTIVYYFWPSTIKWKERKYT